MKAEADADRFLIDVKKVNARVSAATGVSERTVTRIKSERKKVEESGTSFETPNKKRGGQTNYGRMGNILTVAEITTLLEENDELPSVQRIFIQPPEVDGDTSAEDSADEDDGGKLDNLPKTQLAGFGEAVLADGTRMGDEHDEEQGMPRLSTTCDLTEEPISSGISGIGRLTDEATTTPNLNGEKPLICSLCPQNLLLAS
ncbi:hypothetical protein J6590_095107 [Homalodisca vitripennis]|nr:hypothetical protein J6590_095107 [Homalodisca vitripennis]